MKPGRVIDSWSRCTALLLLGVAASPAYSQRRDPFAAARERLVQEDVIGGGIKHPGVIEAIRSTPRHAFVPRQHQQQAYYDMAIPIGFGQTISPPYVVAYMTEQLDPQPTDKVLEIGTGSGYQAAVLSHLVQDVYSIEIVEPLGIRAAQALRSVGYSNVHTKIGDGYQGWSEYAPFDKIIVTCSPENIPAPLVEQLAEGGRMVIPLGERFQQNLYLFRKTSGKLQREELQSTFFVPMTGRAEELREVLPEGPPALAHGSFEELAESQNLPAGWYYARQAELVSDASAPDGKRYLVFKNVTPGRNAHAMQSFGVDGSQFRVIQLSAWVRGENLQQGQTAQQRAHVIIEFYDANRAPVLRTGMGPWLGSFDWKQVSTRIRVPPQAKLAVVGIGLFGGVGNIAFDQVEISVPR